MHNALVLLSALLSLSHGSPVTVPDLDLSSLGHLVVAGQFSGVSVYDDTLQLVTQTSTGSDGLYQQSADGAYATLGQSDGLINAVCSLNNTGVETIYLGGNFSRIGNVSALNVASYTPSTNLFSALSSGVLGTVNALYCDSTNDEVYIGGTFELSNSTNAVTWSVADQRYVTVPFGGFDGPVNAIQGNGDTVLFGGQFDTVAGGDADMANDPQQVNLQTAYITSENPYVANSAFSNPNNIICPSGADGPGDTWLLADNEVGSWSASANFTFRPTSFKIYNTHYGGRGTREFRFVAQPINGILNLTYVDPTTGQQAYCDARCPLSDSSTLDYQEFKFVNVIGMNAFSFDISGWYGTGAGLRGLEIFTEDIYAYAITAYNDPTCANGTYLSTSTDVGSWTATVIGSEPGYLSANLSGLALSTDSVTFEPRISQRGNYSVRMYTPGCLLDDTCSLRGGVSVSVYSEDGVLATNSTIFQTNNHDKYDTIFQGLVSASSSSFRPRVVLTPLAGQSGTINTVASRVQFLELSAIGQSNLNGLYEFNPTTYSSSSFANTTIDTAGASLGYDAIIDTFVVSGSTTFIAGNLTGSSIANVFAVSSGAVSALGDAGVNGPVQSMIKIGQILYIAGNFTALINSTVSANHIVGFNTTAATWLAIGAGTDASVSYLFNNNGVLGVSGSFTVLNAYGGLSAESSQGMAFWDTTNMQWSTSAGNVDGTIRAAVNSNSSLIVAGQVRSTYQTSADSVAALLVTSTSQRLSAVQLPYNTLSSGGDFDVYTGAFYNSSSTSLTILGGQFSTVDSSGNAISDVVFVSKNNSVYGLPAGTLSNGSIVYASHIDGQRVLLGGAFTGTSGSSTLGGLLIYDLESSSLDATQPAALQGPSVQVNSITSRPGVAQIVVAGNFDSAGSLTCPSLCVLDRASTTWQRPAIGLSGNVSSSSWLGQDVLLLAGNMTLNGTAQYLATFNFATQTFASVTSSLLPGPATVAVSDTNSTDSIYVAGQSTSGSAYLAKWDGSSTTDLSRGLLSTSQIYDLQFLPLAKKAATTNAIMDPKRNLLVLGNITLTNNATVSGALFDGASFTPYLLTSTITARPGSVRTLFSEQLISFSAGGSNLSRGVVIVIALAIALFIIFSIVAIGILAAWLRRRREGYRPANQVEKMPAAVPPQSLFGEDDFQSHKGRTPKI